MKRIEALEAIYDDIAECAVVTIMGAVAVELFSLGHRPNFFYLEHAMGLASSMGLGIALSQPDRKVVVWTDAGPWAVETVDMAAGAAVEPALLRRLVHAKRTELVAIHPVMDGQAGLLFVDGAYVRTLGAGVHGFWAVGRMVQMKVVDLKRQSLDVAGQEVLTKDRVTIRVNIAAEYRVVDPLKAVSAVKDFSEALYRALQYAFRKTSSSLTLDQILEKKVTVDEEAAAKVRTDMAEIGV